MLGSSSSPGNITLPYKELYNKHTECRKNRQITDCENADLTEFYSSTGCGKVCIEGLKKDLECSEKKSEQECSELWWTIQVDDSSSGATNGTVNGSCEGTTSGATNNLGGALLLP